MARTRPTRWGFYDMTGNVWEWVQERVARGGAYDTWNPLMLSTFYQFPFGAKKHNKQVGLRLVRTAPE